jgi:hypothetical protein
MEINVYVFRVGSPNLHVPTIKPALTALSHHLSATTVFHRSHARTKKSTFDRADRSLTIEESFLAPRWMRATSSKVFSERG